MLSRFNGKLTCPQCSKTFRGENGLDWHLKNIHGSSAPRRGPSVAAKVVEAVTGRKTQPTLTSSGTYKPYQVTEAQKAIIHALHEAADKAGGVFNLRDETKAIQAKWTGPRYLGAPLVKATKISGPTGLRHKWKWDPGLHGASSTYFREVPSFGFEEDGVGVVVSYEQGREGQAVGWYFEEFDALEGDTMNGGGPFKTPQQAAEAAEAALA